MYLWTSPHGYQHLVDHHGTTDVSADRSRHGRRTPYSTNEVGGSTNEVDDPAPPDE